MLEKLNEIRKKIRSWLLQNNKSKYISFLFLGVVTIILVLFGMFKIFGGEYAETFYKPMNLGGFYRIRIGLVEIIAALLLWFNKTSKIGMFLTTFIMGGASAAHILFSIPGLNIPIFVTIFTIIGVKIKNHGFKFRLWF